MPRRKLTRFKAKRPPAPIIQQYALFYSKADLHFQPEAVPAITSNTLFNNEKPLILDLGCGRGEFTVEQAKQHSEINYVGIDTHAKSLYASIKKAATAKLENIKFMRIDIENGFKRVPDQSIQTLYLLFPPPILKEKFLYKDVITERFVREAHRVLQSGGKLHFVTDIESYFEEKVAYINAFGLFTEVYQSRSVEGGITRFQKLWEDFGELSFRVAFQK